jgi:hypothetical protein
MLRHQQDVVEGQGGRKTGLDTLNRWRFGC